MPFFADSYISVQRVLIRMATRGIILALWSLGLGLPLVCCAAYLPVSGPCNLRFLPPQPIVTIKPPPLPLPAPPQTAFDESLMPTNRVPCTPEPIILKAKSPTLCENNGLPESPNGSPESGAEILVTPQMMVPYFQGGPTENNKNTPHISQPIWFKPPVPVLRPLAKPSSP